MASFQICPLEVRQEVYSYLLMDYNDPDLTPHGLSPRFCTSLFLVSKQISAETTQFFYTRNGFVTIEWPMEGEGGTRNGRYCIMKHTSEERLNLQQPYDQRFFLSMWLKYIRYSRVDLSPRSASFSVISAEQLEKLVKVLNGQHWIFNSISGEFVGQLWLQFSRSNSGFQVALAIQNRILTSLKVLKQPERPFPCRPPQSTSLSIYIDGDLDKEDIESVEAQTGLKLTVNDILQHARDLMQLGRQLLHTGSYAEAMGAYGGAREVTRYVRGREIDDYECCQLNRVALDEMIQIYQLNRTKGGLYKALRRALQVYREWIDPQFQHDRFEDELAEAAELGNRIAEVIRDDNRIVCTRDYSTTYETLMHLYFEHGTTDLDWL